MVAPEEMARFTAESQAMGGRISFAMTKPKIRAAGLQPAYKCG